MSESKKTSTASGQVTGINQAPKASGHQKQRSAEAQANQPLPEGTNPPTPEGLVEAKAAVLAPIRRDGIDPSCQRSIEESKDFQALGYNVTIAKLTSQFNKGALDKKQKVDNLEYVFVKTAGTEVEKDVKPDGSDEDWELVD